MRHGVKGLRTIGFVGPSGTGKSYRAIQLSNDLGIEAIIDDGLLIQGSRILAGSSAKKQATRIGAIKTALFYDPEHRREVKAALESAKPASVMVIGTSAEMIEVIISRLELEPPEQIIVIESVATPQEIARALSSRKKHGKHVVPAPTLEVKPRLSGTIIEPLKTLLKGKEKTSSQAVHWVEQTVVRPTFNYLGRFYIADAVLESIVLYVANTSGLIDEVRRVHIENLPEGVRFSLDVAVQAQLRQPLAPPLQKLQKKIKEEIEYMTSLNVLQVNLIVKGLHVK